MGQCGDFSTDSYTINLISLDRSFRIQQQDVSMKQEAISGVRRQRWNVRSPLLSSLSSQPARCEVLDGWRAIAQYLGMGIRTVQRYERELGLPVRKPAAESRGSVLAT